MIISPKEFLKSRRPEQFSDSKSATETPIDRVTLEYYLDTLTNRSEEVEFEHFARKLCETEICPNLLPTTGPTGGGDSKVDSETYPVSDRTTLGWFVGVGNQAAKDRWAFAFSAKADWKTKVKSDIKKIYEIDRDYKVAYFVTSRFARAKDRSEIEDELRKLYGFEVHILDRSWILDKVFSNERFDIVLETLSGFKLKEEKYLKKGPLDTEKEEELKKLEKNIASLISKNENNHTLVENAIEAAIISRELEKPQIETDGRFQRANILADKYGTQYQEFEAIYQTAWTTFWWKEDFTSFLSLYPKVEEKVINTENIYNLERLMNLWNLLQSIKQRDSALVNEEILQKYTKSLKDKLFVISKQREEKPSASLYANSLLLQIELFEKNLLRQGFDDTLLQIKDLVLASKGLIGFPFKALVNILTEISEALEESPKYEELFKVIIEVSEERDGELSSAKLLLQRGEKLLNLERSYEAIKVLGLSINKLYKNESKKEVVEALVMLAIGYENVGLLWAARGVLLTAASLATSDFWNHDEITAMQAYCYGRLKEIELRLGRIPQALQWHELDYTIRHILLSKGFSSKRLFGEVNRFDLVLGILCLKSNFEVLKSIEELPDALDELQLFNSSIALIYSLGAIKEIPEDFRKAVSEEETEEFFKKWVEQIPNDYLPFGIRPSEEKTILTSKILGCSLNVNTLNEEPLVEVAESLLAAIESFLSTTVLKEAVGKEPLIEINLTLSSNIKSLIEYTIDDSEDRPIVSIKCQDFNPHSVARENQKVLSDLIFGIAIQIIVRIVMFKDPKNDLEAILREERASERSINFTSSFVTLGNVLGHKLKLKFSDWTIGKKKYPLQRSTPLSFPESTKEKSTEENRFNAKHTEMGVVSIINVSMWDKAGWSGTFYMVDPEGSAPPVLGFMFKDESAARKIFDSWVKKIGEHDKKEEIRITIIRGIEKNKPHNYRIVVGSSIEAIKESGAQFIASANRINTMTPNSSTNLDNFLEAYKKFGYYWLVPALTDGVASATPISGVRGIVKKNLTVKNASEIGPNDSDIVGVLDSDNSIIPTKKNI